MVGRKISEFRKQKGMSLSELAERADVSKSYLSMIERGLHSNPSVQFLEKVSSVLGVSVNSLIDNTTSDETLDADWMELARKAQESGMTKQEFIDYLEFYKWKNKQ